MIWDRSCSLKRLEREGHAVGLYGLAQRRMRALIRHIWRSKLSTAGLEKIPSPGPALRAINQTTHLNSIFVGIAGKRPIRFVGLGDGEHVEPSKLCSSLFS